MITEQQKEELKALLFERCSRKASFEGFVLLAVMGLVWLLVFVWLVPTKSIDGFFQWVLTPSMMLFFFGFLLIFRLATLFDKRRIRKDFVEKAKSFGLKRTEIEVFLAKLKKETDLVRGKI